MMKAQKVRLYSRLAFLVDSMAKPDNVKSVKLMCSDGQGFTIQMTGSQVMMSSVLAVWLATVARPIIHLLLPRTVRIDALPKDHLSQAKRNTA